MSIIKILTDKDVKDFNRAAPKHEIVIAGFFMIKCPACEAFKPEWEKFVDSCKSEGDPNVLIAEIDSNQASRVNFDTSALEGFPTVYRDVKGEEGVVEFKHERTKKALRRFLKEAMAVKGGRKKRRKKRKTKKRRKSRRKKKKGGVNNFCALASDNPPEATPQEADRYCQDILETRFAKCKLIGAQKGQCRKLSQDEINLLMYIDPNDAHIANSLLHRHNNPTPTRVQQLRSSSSDPLKPPPLVRSPARQSHSPANPLDRVRTQLNPSAGEFVPRQPRPPPLPPHWARQPRPPPRPPPLVRSPARQSHSPTSIIQPPTFRFGTFTPEELGAMAVLPSDSDSDVDGGYKRKKRKKRRKTRKKRRKRKTKRKRH
jgi:hypothetical protein